MTGWIIRGVMLRMFAARVIYGEVYANICMDWILVGECHRWIQRWSCIETKVIRIVVPCRFMRECRSSGELSLGEPGSLAPSICGSAAKLTAIDCGWFRVKPWKDQ